MADAGSGPVPLPPGYVLVEKLGSGGFATVWLAEQGQLGRRVAVKLLGETLGDDERQRRFVAECRAVGRLSGHPAVVTVHDAGTTPEGHPYLVMEHLPGGSLQDRVRVDGPLSWARAVDVGVSLADALSAAHDTGILHRDVKPANVLLDGSGAPKLADFGIARLAEGTDTATGHVVGTILYTPPEVLGGQRPAPTGDVWSLGALLHTVISGRSPFQGEQGDPPAVSIARVLRCEVPPLPSAVPPDLAALVGELLDREPGRRPQSAAEVARRLQAVQVAHGLPVTPARSTREVVDERAVAGDATRVGFAPISADLIPPRAHPSPIGDDPTTASVGATVPVGATAPVAAGPPPGGVPPGAGQADEPPPGRSARSRRRGAVSAVVAVVVVVALGVVGIVLATGSGGDDAASPGGDAAAPPDPADPARPEDQVETIWGALIPVATGTTSAPAPVEAARRDVDCGGTLRCAATEVDGDPVVAYPADDGTMVVERLSAADGSRTWTLPVATPPSNVALVPAGEVLLLVTTEDDPDTDDDGETLRTYRAVDPTGRLIWGPTAFDDDRGVLRAADQPSPEVSVLTATGDDGPEVIGLSNTSGDERWTHPGRVLAVDESTAYLADGGAVVARDLVSGAETWRRDVAVRDAGASAVARLGVVVDDVLVTVSDDEVVGLAMGDGSDAWDPVPLAAGDVDVGTPLGLSAAGGRAVVVADGGDAGIDPSTGSVAWRVSRPPLLAPGESNVWVGTADRLVAGQLGGTLRAIATDGGEEVASVGVGAQPPSLSTLAFEGGLVTLTEDGLTARATDDLTELWSEPGSAGATTVATVDGGVVVLGADGVMLLTSG